MRLPPRARPARRYRRRPAAHRRGLRFTASRKTRHRQQRGHQRCRALAECRPIPPDHSSRAMSPPVRRQSREGGQGRAIAATRFPLARKARARPSSGRLRACTVASGWPRRTIGPGRRAGQPPNRATRTLGQVEVASAPRRSPCRRTPVLGPADIGQPARQAATCSPTNGDFRKSSAPPPARRRAAALISSSGSRRPRRAGDRRWRADAVGLRHRGGRVAQDCPLPPAALAGRARP